jgi:acyl carrier protein
MNIDDFAKRLEEEFEEIPEGALKSDVRFRDIFEWNSMNALLLMALISTEYDVNISADELRNCNTLGELYTIVSSKTSN